MVEKYILNIIHPILLLLLFSPSRQIPAPIRTIALTTGRLKSPSAPAVPLVVESTDITGAHAATLPFADRPPHVTSALRRFENKSFGSKQAEIKPDPVEVAVPTTAAAATTTKPLKYILIPLGPGV